MTSSDQRVRPTSLAGTSHPRPIAGTVLVLGLLLAAGPLASDLYLPALPQIAADLGTQDVRVQLTLTSMMLGMGLGQLLIGPLSDRWGRRRPLLAGTAMFAVTSLACTVVPNVEVFIAVRFVQGVAAASAAVIARAVVRDLYEGDAVARVLSRTMLVVGLAPTLGPILGAALLRVGTWHLGFLVLAVANAVAVLAVALRLPESLPPEARRALTLRALGATVNRLLRTPAFVGPGLTLAFAFGMMLTYIASFSSVSQHEFGASPGQFALVFGVNTVGLIAGSQVNAALIGRVAASRRLLGGMVAALVPVAALGMLAATGTATLTTSTAALSVMMFSVGFVLPNATALAIGGQVPAVAGTASALLGSAQFAIGGALAASAGLTRDGTPTLASMVLVMSLTGVAALVLLLVVHPTADR